MSPVFCIILYVKVIFLSILHTLKQKCPHCTQCPQCLHYFAFRQCLPIDSRDVLYECPQCPQCPQLFFYLFFIHLNRSVPNVLSISLIGNVCRSIMGTIYISVPSVPSVPRICVYTICKSFPLLAYL